MSHWRKTFDLTEKTLQQFVDNSNYLKKILDEKDKRELFFNRIPCDQFLNFTSGGGANVKLCIEILNLFLNYEDFYNCDERFNYSLEFILVNLTHVTKDCNEILLLLQLLLKLLSKNCAIINSTLKNAFDAERILEMLVNLTKFRLVQGTKFMYYTSILSYLLDSEFPDALNIPITHLFEKFKEYNVMESQLKICKMILKYPSKLDLKVFQNIWEWLVSCGSNALSKSVDPNLLEDVANCLISFIANWARFKVNDKNKNNYLWHFIDTLVQSLTKVASDICLHTSSIRMRTDCFKLLKFIVLKYLNSDITTTQMQDDILKTLESFSGEVEEWPKYDNDLFFCVCHICIENSKMIWKPKDVLNAIMKCFYNRRETIKSFILKSIYYLYPNLIDATNLGIDDFFIGILGEDLLNYFIKLSSVSYLYSYNVQQLQWMLSKGSKTVKVNVIKQWLRVGEKNENLERILISAIEDCKAEMCLLEIMMDNSNLGKSLGIKSAMLLSKTTNKEVSTLITLILPYSIEKPMNFYNLILAQPSVALDPSKSVLMSSLMGAIMPTLTEDKVLKGACIFCSKLLAQNKNNPHSLIGFCRNKDNIQYLVKIIDQVSEETAIAIISLLKVIVLIQQKNKINFGYKINQTCQHFIQGSEEKLNKSLQFLYHVLMCKNSVITLELEDQFVIYDLLLDYSVNPILTSSAYDCIAIMLKRVPWLSLTMSSTLHTEMTCSSFGDSTTDSNILKAIQMWLNVVRKESCNGFCPIPEMAIKSFVVRANIGKTKENEYISIVNSLVKKEVSFDQNFSSVLPIKH